MNNSSPPASGLDLDEIARSAAQECLRESGLEDTMRHMMKSEAHSMCRRLAKETLRGVLMPPLFSVQAIPFPCDTLSMREPDEACPIDEPVAAEPSPPACVADEPVAAEPSPPACEADEPVAAEPSPPACEADEPVAAEPSPPACVADEPVAAEPTQKSVNVRKSPQKGAWKFNSSAVPDYVKRSAQISSALPWLYLKGICKADLQKALKTLVGDHERDISPLRLSRLVADWCNEYAAWSVRPIQRPYAYLWADGIDAALSASRDRPLSALAIAGVGPDGTKEWVAIREGRPDSAESWLDMLEDLRARGLTNAPLLASGDRKLGIWSALEEIYPETRHQYAWTQPMERVLRRQPEALLVTARADLTAIWTAETREDALRAYASCAGRYPGAAQELKQDLDKLLTFYEFPTEHWTHLRNTNPIQATYGSVRHRSADTLSGVPSAIFLGLMFKLAQSSAETWRRINAPDTVATLLERTPSNGGILFPRQPSQSARASR